MTMKIKLNGEYITTVNEKGEEVPLEFTTALLHNNTDVELLDDDGAVLESITGFFPSAYTLEGGDWTKAPVNVQVADQDKLMLKLVAGTTPSTVELAQLHARLVYNNAETYPTDVPSELRQETYNQYTNHYRFYPPIDEPTEE